MIRFSSARTEKGPQLHRYRELDGIRGLAALAVFLHHVGFSSIQNRLDWNGAFARLFQIFGYGAYGVDFFFVLSGFLITSILIQDRANPFFYRDFYWKRALRILPMYVLTLVIIGVLIPLSRTYILLSIFFICNFGVWFRVAASGPLWSLAIEEQFYLLWPRVVRSCSAGVLAGWATGLWVGTIVLRIAAASLGRHDYYITPLRADGLAAGALLACWNIHRRQRTLSLRFQTSLNLGALLVGGTLTWAGTVPKSPRGLPFGDAMTLTGVVFCATACIGFVIRHSGDGKLAWLRSTPLLFLGGISYAFYMLHLYVMVIYDRIFGAIGINDARAYAIRMGSVLLGTALICLVTRHLIELPAISLRRYVIARPTKGPESALPVLSD